MADCDLGRAADPHVVGTIWGSALWDLRSRLAVNAAEHALDADRLVLAMLLELGQPRAGGGSATVADVCRDRAGFEAGLAALLDADRGRFAGRYRSLILQVFAVRGIMIGERV
jgi:hypothetical protein